MALSSAWKKKASAYGMCLALSTGANGRWVPEWYANVPVHFPTHIWGVHSPHYHPRHPRARTFGVGEHLPRVFLYVATFSFPPLLVFRVDCSVQLSDLIGILANSRGRPVAFTTIYCNTSDPTLAVRCVYPGSTHAIDVLTCVPPL